jgi:hypothetical protein
VSPSSDTPQPQTCIYFRLTDYYTDANKKNPLTILTTLVASLSLSSIFSFISNHPKFNINNPKALGHQIKLLSSDFAREVMTYSCEKEKKF